MPFVYPEVGVRQNEGEWTALSPGTDHVLRLLVMAYDTEVHPEHYIERASEWYKHSIFPEAFEALRAAFQLDEEREFLGSAAWEMEKRVQLEEHRQRREREADSDEDEG